MDYQIQTLLQLSTHLRALRKARGLWKDRSDLPDFSALRAEFDREAR